MATERETLPDEIAKGHMTLEQAWKRLAELDAADELSREAQDDGFYDPDCPWATWTKRGPG